MVPIAQTVFDNYQIRKTRKQKQAFIDLLKAEFPEIHVQESKYPKNRNLILGNVENSKILLTAHYDTCAWLPIPNFIAPLNPLLSIGYSLILVIPILFIIFLLNRLPAPFSVLSGVFYWIAFIFCFGLGPANPHTANDNTSGVITLLEIYAELTEEERHHVAFVFFDNEENGLIGSSIFRRKYKKKLDQKLLINFDCVSDGDTLLLAISKKARKEHAYLEKAFHSTSKKQYIIKNAEKVYYPSDQAGFASTVAVAALNQKKGVGYYINRIHTKKDIIMDEENIRLLKECTLNLVRHTT